jgi:hypothetical protein
MGHRVLELLALDRVIDLSANFCDAILDELFVGIGPLLVFFLSLAETEQSCHQLPLEPCQSTAAAEESTASLAVSAAHWGDAAFPDILLDWMFTLICMLRLHAVQQGNQTGQFHVALEKDRHRAKCRVELFADLRPKADRARSHSFEVHDLALQPRQLM